MSPPSSQPDDPTLVRRNLLIGTGLAALAASLGVQLPTASAQANEIVLWPNGTKARPTISSNFGPRTAPTPGASTDHKGTDFVGFSLVRAVADGVVAESGTPSGWSGGGQQVWIQHNGFLTRSLHLTSRAVAKDQPVSAGDVLGEMGNTGNVTGVHLHLEVVVNGSQIDPVPFITTRLNSTTTAEDTMTYSISVNGNQYAIGQQYISHYGSSGQATITRQVTSASDELHTLNLTQFADLLDGLGIPRSVLDNAGRVLNPQSGVHEANGVWSREREILAALKKLADRL